MKFSVRGRVLIGGETHGNDYFSITAVDDLTCVLSYTGIGFDTKDLTLRVSDLGHYESMTIYFSQIHGLLPVKNLVNSRDTCQFYKTYYNCSDTISAYFARGGGDDSVLVLHGNAEVGNWTNEVRNTVMTSNAIACQLLPGFANTFTKRRDAKVDLMRKVSPLDSLSSLEKQVDLLSALVIQLAALVPGSDSVGLIQKIKAIIDDAGSNSNKSEDQSVSDIVSFKRSLREAQGIYFNKLKSAK
jgi:hypothetical protein